MTQGKRNDVECIGASWCTERAVANSMCRVHDMRSRRGNNMEAPLRTRKTQRPPCVECGGAYYSGERCKPCYNRWYSTNRLSTEVGRNKHAAQQAFRRTWVEESLVHFSDEVNEFSKTYWTSLYGQPCAECGEPSTEIDHIVPLSVGGYHVWWNFRPLCTTHNRQKNNRLMVGGVNYRD